MDQDKFIKLQLQMKQNNEDYKDFLDGMESWTDEIKNKEKKLITDPALIQSNNSFPIRNSVIRVNKNKKQKINAYDYAAWDKFDVDKALNDEEESNDDDDESQTEQRMAQLVKEHREVGNIRFKEGDYTEATAEYTKAILCDGTNSVLYNNRAMSLLKMGSYEAAEVDCCKAIELDNTSVKAFYRRAKCRLLLQRKEDALDDLYAVLRLDPDNKLAQTELRELERDLNIRGVVTPLFGAPKKGFESSRPLVSVNIVDVDPNKPLSDLIKERSQCAPVTSITPPQPASSITESVTINDTMPSFSVPSTALQLSRDLTKYGRHPSHRANYLALIPHKLYRTLIGYSLDCKLLQHFVDGLSFALQHGIITAADYVARINSLANVARFSSLWLMMSAEDKHGFSAALSLLDPPLAATLTVTV